MAFHFLLQNSDLSRSLESMGGSPRTHPLVQLAPGLSSVVPVPEVFVEQGVVESADLSSGPLLVYKARSRSALLLFAHLSLTHTSPGVLFFFLIIFHAHWSYR